MELDPIFALIAIIFGILVIVFKDLLSWIVGIAFILVGLYLLIQYINKPKTTSQPPVQKTAATSPGVVLQTKEEKQKKEEKK